MNRDEFLQTYYDYKDKLNIMTQQQMAEITGVNRRYISELERGKRTPQYRTIRKIFDALKKELGKSEEQE